MQSSLAICPVSVPPTGGNCKRKRQTGIFENVGAGRFSRERERRRTDGLPTQPIVVRRIQVLFAAYYAVKNLPFVD